MANDIAVAMSATQLARKRRADDVTGKGRPVAGRPDDTRSRADQRCGGDVLWLWLVFWRIVCGGTWCAPSDCYTWDVQ